MQKEPPEQIEMMRKPRQIFSSLNTEAKTVREVIRNPFNNLHHNLRVQKITLVTHNNLVMTFVEPFTLLLYEVIHPRRIWAFMLQQ